MSRSPRCRLRWSYARCGVVGGELVCVKSDVLGWLVGCSLGNNKITDVGAVKIAGALPNSKLRILE